MSEPARESSWSPADVLGAFAAVAVVCVADAIGIVQRPPGVDLDSGLVVFAAVGLSLGGLAATAIVLSRGAARRALSRFGAIGAAIAATGDVAVLYALASHVQDPRDLQGEARALALVGLLAAGAVVGALTARSLRGQRIVAVAAIVGAAVLEHKLRWLSEEWMRLALNLAWVVGGAVLLRPLLVRFAGRRSAIALVATAVAVLAVSGALVRGSPSARRALWGRSSPVYGWLAVVSAALDRDGDEAVGWLGGRDCDPARRSVHPGASERAGNGLDDNCAGGDVPVVSSAPEPSPARRSSRPPDILVLSIDSLRWDIVDALPALSGAIGSHARFTRAVSPAAKTTDTLAALLRGRPSRQVRLERLPGVRGRTLWRDRSPTLGHALTARGYRVVTVPTDGYLDPRYGIGAGFEALYAAAYDARGLGLAWNPFERDRMRTQPALDVLLRVARATPGPLCGWIHAMEPHFPFYWGARGKGPWSVEGLRHSVRALDQPLARFVEAFGRARGRRPIVAVLGDHGEEIWEHGGSAHGSSVHAEQVRVGLLLGGEDVAAATIDAPVSVSSIAPTLVELAGARVPSSMTEPSLVAALAGDAAWPTMAVSESSVSGRGWVGYTGPRYRLLVEPEHDLAELYDAETDPLELHDLARKRPEALRTAQREARRWDERH